MQFRVSEKELGKIFDKAKNTNDFIQAKSILLNDSRSIILFRLHLGISRNKFSRLLGKSVNTIANLERGNKKLTPEERDQRAKIGGITAKLKNAGIHSKRHLWMEWFKEGLKKSGRRTSKGPKNETMVNELEAKVARKLFSMKINYKYEPLFKVQDQIFYPDFVVTNTIIECCYWEHEDRWLYLANKFAKIYGNGFKCILVTKRNCKQFFHLIPSFVTIVVEDNLNDLGAYLLPYGCQPPR